MSKPKDMWKIRRLNYQKNLRFADELKNIGDWMVKLLNSRYFAPMLAAINSDCGYLSLD